MYKWPPMTQSRLGPALASAVLFNLAAGCSGGSTCTVVDNADGSATITCDDGTSATVTDGMNGTDGTQCTVADDGMGGRVITCDDGTTVTVRDGMDGTDGTDGQGPWVTGPGLILEVTEQGIGADRRPYVVLRLTDQEGVALDREGLLTEGAVSVSFTIAHLPSETRVDGSVALAFVSYLTRSVTSADGMTTVDQPTTDAMGTWTLVDRAMGTYRYDFGGVLPDTYVATETHRIGIYATRTYEDVRYVANATPTFRPDGMTVTQTRDIVTNAACNQCHNPISAHGGARESVELCTTCHGRDVVDPDTGESLDFETMTHRIHRGGLLPSVVAGEPFEIVGFRGTVHDYSETRYPRDIRGCHTCHQGPDGDRYLTVPSRAACGSCHDDIWFEAGDPPAPWMSLHPGGDRPDDDRCTVCHEATGGLSPIDAAHFTALEAPDAMDIGLTIDALTVPAAGPPVVDFTVTVNGAPHDVIATPFDRLRMRVAGPTTDYQFNHAVDLRTEGTLASRGMPGQFRYTFPRTIAQISTLVAVPATGTWAFGFEGRAVSPSGNRYSVPNVIRFVAMTDPTAVPRRQIVAIESCNGCHEELAAHGGTRSDSNFCSFCHNPTLDDSGDLMPPPGSTATAHPVNLAYMVHRLHTGADGESPYFEFDDLHFPSDRRDCLRCHVDADSYSLPLPATNAPAQRRVVDSTGAVIATLFVQPTTNACSGCHDGAASVAHAETMTTAMGVEGCAACHAAGSAFGVDVVHARPEYDIRTP